MQKIRLDRYTNPRRIVTSMPSSMERILARCMEKLPANRYPSTQILIDDLPPDYIRFADPLDGATARAAG